MPEPLNKTAEIHPSVSIERVMEALSDGDLQCEYYGFCIKCGTEHTGVEPDACNYPCENEECGEHQVFGAEELLFMLK